MKEEWLFPNAIIPVNVETTQALVVEIKRLIDVVGGMALECPNCEYHRKRAQLWRDEAYKQAGHPLPEQDGECKHCTDGCPACDARKLPEQDWIERERAVGYREGHRAALAQRTWVGLTLEEILETYRGPDGSDYVNYARAIEAKLKEKNE